jgi:hypothetical protein
LESSDRRRRRRHHPEQNEEEEEPPVFEAVRSISSKDLIRKIDFF